MENNIHRKKDSARLFRDNLIGPACAEASAGREDELDKQKMNRLIWGDNLLAMQALLAQGYEGKINLIYIDPPFDSKADYSHKIKLPSSVIPAEAGIHNLEITKEPSVIERLAYKDTWAGGICRLVILAWDYEYNYDELLQTRLKAVGKDIKTEIISRQIPPDIYEYLKKARNEEEIEKLAEKIKFFEKPYLKVRKPEVKGNIVSVGIDNYVLYDFPLGSGKKADESREELIHLVKDNFAILIDYMAIDWDYDGIVFKSQWQDFRGNGRKAKIVATKKEHTYEKNGKHKIAMRVVDIFGNDATAIIEIDI